MKLTRALKKSEMKLKNNRSKSPSPLEGIGRSSELAANKIVELSKKIRELNAELGTAQNKARIAEKKLKELEQGV